MSSIYEYVGPDGRSQIGVVVVDSNHGWGGGYAELCRAFGSEPVRFETTDLDVGERPGGER